MDVRQDSTTNRPANDAAAWNWHRLAILLTLASVLIASWVVPPFSSAWQRLDETIFAILNKSLEIGSGWQTLVALANNRAFDLVAGFLVVAVLCIYVFRTERTRRRAGWSGIASLLVLVLVGHKLVGGIVHQVFHYERASPTLVVSDCLRLSDLVPSIAAKDASPLSFPGDHGYVVICVALFLTTFATRRLATIGWVMAIALSLPRLISGAHWFSDIAIGSLVFAILTIGPFSTSPARALCLPRTEAPPDAGRPHHRRAA